MNQRILSRVVPIPAAATVLAPVRLWTANKARKSVTVFALAAVQIASSDQVPGMQFRPNVYISFTREVDGVDWDCDVFPVAAAGTTVEILEILDE